MYCSGFTGSLVIPSSITSIGSATFYNCTGFTGSLEIPSSVKRINTSAFSNWGNVDIDLTIGMINIPESFWNNSFSSTEFKGKLIFNSSVTIIGSYAFYNCSGFTGSLVIPSSVTSIGSYAFGDCTGFAGSLEIPSSVKRIDTSAFSNWGNVDIDLTIGMINIPESFWNNSFSSTEFKGKLIFNSSVTIIGSYAFYNCSGFTGSLVIPSSVTSIGSYAFSGCTGLIGYLTIDAINITIQDFAFSNTGLNKINVTSENINATCSPDSFVHNITAINVPEKYSKSTFCGIEINNQDHDNNQHHKNNLSAGAISAITIASVAVIIGAVVVVYFIIKSKRTKNQEQQIVSKNKLI